MNGAAFSGDSGYCPANCTGCRVAQPSSLLNYIPGTDAVPVAAEHLPLLHRLLSRYGCGILMLLHERPELAEFIPGTPYCWAELVHAAGEMVVHLDDLLLRRLRIGILCRDGGAALLPRIGELIRPILKWDEDRWENECRRYLAIRNKAYGTPPGK